MSERNVRNFPGRGSLNDGGFQSALRAWRHIAHRHDLVVASPVRLIGAERTFMGDSDDESFGPKDYKLENVGELGWDLPGVGLSKAERAILQDIGESLSDHSEFDIKDVRAPSSAQVDVSVDERGRWDIMATKNHRLGTVVRIGEGSRKRYILSLWDGGFHRVDGQPPYDLPLFGLPELVENTHKPVMIHEGPKSWMGAVVKSARGRHPLAEWLNVFTHVGWHGSDVGMEWTDWSPLRGRKVVIWSDMDEVGVDNARMLARRIALMGNVVEIIQWGRDDIEKAERWDWGDPLTGFPATLTRTDIIKRIDRIESPVNAAGRLIPEFLRRSAYDPAKNEIYLESRDYQPMPLGNLCIPYSKGLAARIAGSNIRIFKGLTYEPGRPFGPLKSGLLNTCRPNMRAGIAPTPLDPDIARELHSKWLARMIPRRRDRMYLIRKAALAIARPDKVSQQLVVLMGGSGIGKSVLLDLIVSVAGEDRATSLFPASAIGKFNSRIARKSIVCIHEIHAIEGTRRQQEGRFKELMGNSTIELEAKNRDMVSMKNVINWFAATNEKTPFLLEQGNNRNYFIQCESPRDARDARERDRFFRNWVDRLKEDEELLDQLYAAALWLVDRMSSTVIAEMMGRAKKQDIWDSMKEEVLPPWQQFVVSRLEELREEAGDRPLCFVGEHVVRLTLRDYKNAGEENIRRFMRNRGFGVIRDEKGAPAKVRLNENSGQSRVWAELAKMEEIVSQWKTVGLPSLVKLSRDLD